MVILFHIAVWTPHYSHKCHNNYPKILFWNHIIITLQWLNNSDKIDTSKFSVIACSTVLVAWGQLQCSLGESSLKDALNNENTHSVVAEDGWMGSTFANFDAAWLRIIKVWSDYTSYATAGSCWQRGGHPVPVYYPSNAQCLDTLIILDIMSAYSLHPYCHVTHKVQKQWS